MESAHQFTQIQMTSQQSFQNGNIHVCVLSYSEKGSVFFAQTHEFSYINFLKNCVVQ